MLHVIQHLIAGISLHLVVARFDRYSLRIARFLLKPLDAICMLLLP